MQKHVFRDIKRPYIKILTQPSKWSAQINKSSPSNKRVALRKKAEINNCRGYYYSVGKSNERHWLLVDYDNPVCQQVSCKVKVKNAANQY